MCAKNDSHTLEVAPSWMTLPRSSKSVREHKRSTCLMLWLTSKTVAPLSLNDLLHSGEAFSLKGQVSDSQYLVDDQYVRANAGCDGESESHLHTGAVALDRRIDELLEFGECHDFIEVSA